MLNVVYEIIWNFINVRIERDCTDEIKTFTTDMS